MVPTARTKPTRTLLAARTRSDTCFGSSCTRHPWLPVLVVQQFLLPVLVLQRLVRAVLILLVPTARTKPTRTLLAARTRSDTCFGSSCTCHPRLPVLVVQQFLLRLLFLQR